MKRKQGWLWGWLLVSLLGMTACGVLPEEDGLGEKKQAQLYVGETDSTYSAIITGMPDFTQRRISDPSLGVSGLPGDGEKYCGPAAALNLLSYVAQHGYSHVIPGNVDFTPRSETGENAVLNRSLNKHFYEVITGHLRNLGTLMSTSTVSGTDTSNLAAALRTRLGSQFTVTVEGERYCRKTSTVGPKKLFNHLKAGRLVIMKYGVHEVNSAGYMRRVGGHFVTAIGASKIGDRVFINYRDPYHDGGSIDNQLTSQSPFRNEVRDVAKERVHHSSSCHIDRWRLLRPGYTGTKIWFMEQFIVVQGPRPFQ